MGYQGCDSDASRYVTSCYVYNGNGVAIGEGKISPVGYVDCEVGVERDDDISGRQGR